MPRSHMTSNPHRYYACFYDCRTNLHPNDLYIIRYPDIALVGLPIAASLFEQGLLH